MESGATYAAGQRPDAPGIPAAISPTVRRLAVRSQRVGNAAFVLLLGGAFLGITALKSNGFVVAELLPWAAVPFVLGLALTVLARRQVAEVRRAAGLARKDSVGAVLHPRDLLVVPDGWAPVFAVFGLIGFATVTLFTLPVAVAAASLHRPITTAVLSAGVSDSCGRCHHSASAVFPVDGRTVTAQLAAPGISEDTPTSVVYDADSPTHAMSAADYAFGSSQVPRRRLAGAFLLGAASMGWGLLLNRRTRLFLRFGRPTVAIAHLELRTPNRGPTRWHVLFTDGKHGDYTDTPHQRALLAARIAADPGGFVPPPATAMELLRPTISASGARLRPGDASFWRSSRTTRQSSSPEETGPL